MDGARPHFQEEERFDPRHPDIVADLIAQETPRRFARLQRRYGRWGLAYLESILRAADVLASQGSNSARREGARPPLQVGTELVAMRAPADDSICVRVDLTNPGQFFACCGLLELADRCWNGVEGWFADEAFHIRCLSTCAVGEPTLAGLLETIAWSELRQVDRDNDLSSPVELGAPFSLRLDWWNDTRGGGKALKVWAGRMGSVRIARAMLHVLSDPKVHSEALLNHATVVRDPTDLSKKVEPYYFDSRRGSNARSLDIGFAPDSLGMTTAAYPAVEFLCLVGLQRFRPMAAGAPRVFEYRAWSTPLAPEIAPTVMCGSVDIGSGRAFRFENAFRTDQRKHKAFTPAIELPRS